MKKHSYRDLEVWQKAMDLVVEVYKLTEQFPDKEKFGLAAQIQRAAVSIPANIAEGQGRMHKAENLHHLSYARGSHYELETHLLIAVRLDYIDRETAKPIWELMQVVGRLLSGLIRALKDGPEQDL